MQRVEEFKFDEVKDDHLFIESKEGEKMSFHMNDISPAIKIILKAKPMNWNNTAPAPVYVTMVSEIDDAGNVIDCYASSVRVDNK